ncbi:MAG TPA: hypothetical protein VIH86_14930 [Puia sp.]|jgi:hypothetical protein
MRLKIAFLFYIGVMLISCNKTAVISSPAQAISGKYEAKTYNDVFSALVYYPINGQTMSLQIDPISKDSVRVEVNSTVNGFYSPGNSKIYPSVFVVKKVNANEQFDGMFIIALAPSVDPGTLENSIWFDSQNNAYYTFIPPNYTKGAIQTMFVRTN